MSYYALLGQVAGTGLNWEASQRRQRQLQALQDSMRGAENQANSWQVADEQAMNEGLESLQTRRHGSQLALAEELGSPLRTGAGNDARLKARADIGRVLAANDVNPSSDRSITGNAGGFSNWAGAERERYQPVLDARINLQAENRGQREMGRWDTHALDRAANVDTDINRQANEIRRQYDLNERRRQIMLAEAGVMYADPGPTNGQQNLQLFGSMLGAAGGMADSYNASRQPASAGASSGGTPANSTSYVYYPYRNSPSPTGQQVGGGYYGALY
jgi:hypothetical protein